MPEGACISDPGAPCPPHQTLSQGQWPLLALPAAANHRIPRVAVITNQGGFGQAHLGMRVRNPERCSHKGSERPTCAGPRAHGSVGANRTPDSAPGVWRGVLAGVPAGVRGPGFRSLCGCLLTPEPQGPGRKRSFGVVEPWWGKVTVPQPAVRRGAGPVRGTEILRSARGHTLTCRRPQALSVDTGAPAQPQGGSRIWESLQHRL